MVLIPSASTATATILSSAIWLQIGLMTMEDVGFDLGDLKFYDDKGNEMAYQTD